MLTVFYLGLLLGIADGSLPPTPQSNMISKQLEQVSREFDLNTYTQQWLETCEHINGTQASEDIQTALFTLSDCVTSKINIVNITEEIKAAAPRGALDEVFTSYCNLVPGIKHCRTPMISALQVCLSHQRDDDLQLIDSAIDGALDFMCFKGGERIAIFLAENGTDCLYDNADRIASCINDTMPQVQSLLQNLQLFNESIFDPVNCELETQLKACVVDNLQRCTDPTPANVIEGLIDAMIFKTPCYSAASYFQSSFFLVILLVWLSIMIYR